MSASKTISIVIPDNVVVIDGVGFACEGLPVQPAGLHAMHWRPTQKPRGTLEWIGKPDNDKAFDDFGRLDAYVEAWGKAKAKRDKAAAEAKALQEKAQREAKEQMEAAKVAMEEQARKLERMRPYHEALGKLGNTDHEVIKAAEEGRPVDPALAAQRTEWRNIARSEKAKLKAEGLLK
jgi:hypothetical protein